MKDFSKLTESLNVTVKVNEDTRKALLKESSTGDRKLPTVLMPKIEAIHPGATRNHNRYVAERLRGNFEKKSGIFSWTYPYPKPMIYNHDPSDVRQISGRIYNAQYVSQGVNGQEAVVIIPKITNQEDIRRILDGELLTVSIGATTDSAVCSVCGTDLINEEFCGHHKGETYDGTVCEYIVGDVWFDECSWVTVPADSNAAVVDTGVQVAEAFAQIGDDYFALNREASNAKLQKAAVLTEGLLFESTEAGSMMGGGSGMMDPKQMKKMMTAHAALHAAFRSGKGASKEEIIKQHTKMVKQMLDGKGKHMMTDALDDTLPEDLKKRSGGKKKKEGTETVLNLKELDLSKVTDEELQEALNDVMATVEAADATIQTLTTEKAEVETKLTEAEAKVTEAETKITEAESKVTEAEAKVTEAESKLAEAESAKTALTEANDALKAAVKDALIERVLDNKILLGRASYSQKEELRTELAARSEESLKDTLADLIKEAASGGATAALINSVKNPGVGTTEDKHDIDPKTAEELDPVQRLKSRLLR